ncbi:MAG TPA: class I SAM-dependent methyltransferase [Actinomycetes bacterium]|nr:class I SAM-dependent methyltransferase [Actinomycetes bacterium]
MTVNDLIEAAPEQTTALTVEEYGDPARYDLEYGQPGADAPFYRQLADDVDGPILDLACGTGRIALDLARAGHDVTAVDVSDAMLAHAASKPGAEDVEWVQQDARELKLRPKFALVALAGNSFQAFLTNDDRDAVLKAIYRHLRPGGRLAFSIRFPQPHELARRVDVPELWHSYLDADGHQVLVSGTQHYHPVAQVMHHTTYRHFAVDGIPAEAPTSVELRYHFPQELEASLRAARFQVEERYGDFDGGPLGEQATTMVYVCRKPESVRRTA